MPAFVRMEAEQGSLIQAVQQRAQHSSAAIFKMCIRDSTLHGGIKGFDKLVWQGHEIPRGVELTLVSKDGDQGFPGTLNARVRYTLEAHALKIEYFATTDKDTVPVSYTHLDVYKRQPCGVASRTIGFLAWPARHR